MAEKKTILLTTYHEAFLHRGGGEYELLELALNLRKLGYVADVYGPYSNELETYDTVVHFSIHDSGLPLVEACKAAGKRIVLWPNYWTNHEGRKADTGACRFWKLSDVIVFKSETEKANFASVASLNDSRTLIVSTGVDPIYAEKPPEKFFKETFDIDDYLLWVGIFEPRKNQLEVIRALHDFETPVVFIGNYRDEAYYQACREAAPAHFLFLGPMEHKSDILRSAIRESRLYIEPTLDPAGKSVLEAAICGTRVLVSDAPWEREHLGSFAVYVNPMDPESIRAGVRQGLMTPVDPAQAPWLSRKHLLPGVLDCLTALL